MIEQWVYGFEFRELNSNLGSDITACILGQGIKPLAKPQFHTCVK